MPASVERIGPGRRWITPAECAERLGLHPQTVYVMIARGDLPSGRIGRAVRIDWPAVERGLEGQAPPPTKGRAAPKTAAATGKIRGGIT